jgi:hypothetical protein
MEDPAVLGGPEADIKGVCGGGSPEDAISSSASSDNSAVEMFLRNVTAGDDARERARLEAALQPVVLKASGSEVDPEDEALQLEHGSSQMWRRILHLSPFLQFLEISMKQNSWQSLRDFLGPVKASEQPEKFQFRNRRLLILSHEQRQSLLVKTCAIPSSQPRVQ